MCGIIGSVNFSFDISALNLIAHRGPDDFGFENFTVGDEYVLLAQRRLAIQDLSQAGHQPMVSCCGNYSLIFNGEIYNHLDLRGKLPKSIVFNGHSDTETIFHYLMHFGIDAIADFNGIFSLALLDKNNKKLYLARDPFGVKPLYYSEQSNVLLFASEIRPIRFCLDELSLNRSALASLLRLRFNTSPYTLFKEIKKLSPGSYIGFSLGDGCLKDKEYYFARSTRRPVVSKGPNLVREYGEKLEQAVKRQLIADVEVGILLSGGIDSAVVAALAKRHYQGHLKAFTIGFEGEHVEDEVADAAHTAALLGLEHHVRRIGFPDFLELIKACSNIVEEPLATTSMIPMYYLSELASEHVSVVLTGQGADEPLGGYARYKIELLRRFIPAVLRPLIKPLIGLFSIKNEQISRGANSIAVKDEISRFLRVYEIFSSEEIEQLIGVDDALSKSVLLRMVDSMEFSTDMHTVEKMMAIDARLNLADDLLNYTDKVTMHFSLECRVPMLDIELVRFIEAMPLGEKLNARCGKIIHRKFAERLLPNEIINRPKKGFQSPTQIWFKEGMPRIKSILLAEKSRFSEVFNLRAVEVVLDQHLKGINREKQIFLFLSLYFWFEENSEALF